MKTTIEINSHLFNSAKRLATENRTTFRMVIESALRQYIEQEKKAPSERFRLRKHSFKGKGLQPGFQEDDWREIRHRAYEGRGG